MNWNDIEVKEFGEFKTLTLGGQELIILEVKEDETTSCRPRLTLKVDIASGTDKGFFKEQFDNDTRNPKKWSKGGEYSVLIDMDEKTLPFYKALITSIEKSNNIKIDMVEDKENNKFTFDYAKIIGKKIGAIYGLEEYMNDKGELKTATKIRYIRSVDSVRNAQIPDVKTIGNKYVSYDDYMEKKERATQNNFVNMDTNEDIFPF